MNAGPRHEFRAINRAAACAIRSACGLAKEDGTRKGSYRDVLRHARYCAPILIGRTFFSISQRTLCRAAFCRPEADKIRAIRHRYASRFPVQSGSNYLPVVTRVQPKHTSRFRFYIPWRILRHTAAVTRARCVLVIFVRAELRHQHRQPVLVTTQCGKTANRGGWARGRQGERFQGGLANVSCRWLAGVNAKTEITNS